VKLAIAVVFACIGFPGNAQQRGIPTTNAGSVGGMLRYIQGQFLSVAEAMPDVKYSFVPSGGNFEGVRSFGEQVKHVACGNFAFFNEIEGKIPPVGCAGGGPSPAKTKAELLQYLRESFDYGNGVLSSINGENALARAEGPYMAPNTRLGLAVTAVWHISDHYGQLALYLRMNGIVPPPSQR
jgi:DinB superfamily